MKHLACTKLIAICIVTAIGTTASAQNGRDETSTAIARALADPARAADQKLDARRKPASLIGLSGVHAGQKVLDLIPGNGYWTKIFSFIVGPRGRVYAVWPQQYARLAASDVATLRRLSATAKYANVVTQVQPTTALAKTEPLDLIWTSQNYHDYGDEFMGAPGPASLARDAYARLRPGGIFIVIDHSAAKGRGVADTERLHRIDAATVKQQARAAGFEFAGESRVLLNQADPLNIPVFDKSIRGHTSQFALKFRKPR